MLIAERTVSQVGYIGLFLRAKNGTVFVGPPTSGANGDVTSLVLPASIAVSFTGEAVPHPDGSPLQQPGLVPNAEAHPRLPECAKGATRYWRR
jgi:hypothetical protein